MAKQKTDLRKAAPAKAERDAKKQPQPAAAPAPAKADAAPKHADRKEKPTSAKPAMPAKPAHQKKPAASSESKAKEEKPENVEMEEDEQEVGDEGVEESSTNETSGKAHRENTKKSFKEIIVEGVQDFKSIYLLSLDKLGNKDYNDLHADWKASRIYRGKHAMQIAKEAFGTDVESSFEPELYQLGNKLVADNSQALLFTSRPRAEVESFFANYCNPCFPKPGYVQDENIVVPAGVLPFPLSMQSQLENMGLKTTADREKKELHLLKPYYMVRKNEKLSGDQARMCQLMDRRIAKLKVDVLARWESGSYEEY